LKDEGRSLDMKRTAIVTLFLFALGALAGPAAASHSKDFKVIQNAVKQDPAAHRDKEKGRGREARWLKVLIRDDGPDGGEIRLSLPAALIELALADSDGHHFKVDDDHCEIDLHAVWKALKKAGPHALVEIKDDGAVFRVWLE
jgi:hypothetical protein